MKFINRLIGRGTKKAPSGPGITRPEPAARPTLSAEQIDFLVARCDVEKWNATADADNASEAEARGPQATRA